MKTIAIIVVILAAGLAFFIRYQAPDPEIAHVDPENADFPAQSGVRRTGDDAVHYAATPSDVLTAFVEIATASASAEVLAGSPESGMVTVLTRSRVLRFQDYVTAKAEADETGTRLTLAARTRYPSASDWGVNRKRLENWLGELSARLAEAGG